MTTWQPIRALRPKAASDGHDGIRGGESKAESRERAGRNARKRKALREHG